MKGELERWRLFIPPRTEIVTNTPSNRIIIAYRGVTKGGVELKVASKKSLSRHADLTGMPLHSLGQYGTALANSASKAMKGELAALNLNDRDFTLIRLFLPDQEWTLSELTEILPMDAPAISRVVSKLVDKDILTRRRPKEDRRVVLLKLTNEGEALGLQLHEKLHAYEAELTRGIPEEEIEILRSVIRRILHNHSSLDHSG